MTPIPAPAAWTTAALCAQVGVPSKPAREICLRCEVLEQCRAEALADPDLDGVWGATTKRDRNRIRNQPAPTDKEARPHR